MACSNYLMGLIACRLLKEYSRSYDFGSFDWEYNQYTLNMLVGSVIYLINFLVSVFGMSTIHKSEDKEGSSGILLRQNISFDYLAMLTFTHCLHLKHSGR